jgi:hypothetical protein
MENYKYGFIKKATGEGIRLRMKPEVFPENFLEFRNWIRPLIKGSTATPAQKKAFMSAKQHFIDMIMITEQPSFIGYSLDGDADIDRDDVFILLSYRNQPATVVEAFGSASNPASGS